MEWDMLEEHKVCYKDKNILKRVNGLTDLFDDVIIHIHDGFGYCEFFTDVFYTETEDVETGIIEQLTKYTEMFLYEEDKQKFKNDKFVYEYRKSGHLYTLLKESFDLDVYNGEILKDEKTIELLKELSDNIISTIGVSDGAIYEVLKTPKMFKEFYPLVFISHIIRCGYYTFLIMYGTSD